jgi:hypothetical protein
LGFLYQSLSSLRQIKVTAAFPRVLFLNKLAAHQIFGVLVSAESASKGSWFSIWFVRDMLNHQTSFKISYIALFSMAGTL